MTIAERLKKIVKLKRTWIIGMVVLGGVYVAYAQSRPPKIDYITQAVRRGTLTQTVSATGAVESTAALNINFEVSGILREIYVAEGEHVVAGQKLAKLDTVELDKQVARAGAELAAAQANLQKVIEGATEQDIRVSQENVTSAQVAYDNAVRDDAALRLKLDADIQAADISLEDTKVTKAQAITDARTNYLTTLESKLSLGAHALDVIKVVFDDADLKTSFSVNNPQYKNDASLQYDQGRVKLVIAQTSLALAKQSSADEPLAQALSDAKTAFTTINLALANTFLGLSSSLTSASFTPAEQETYKTDVKTQQANMDAAIAAADAGYQGYVNAQIAYTTSVNAAASALTTAQTSKEVQLSASTAKIASAKSAHDLAVAQLKLKQAPARSSDIAFYRGQVGQAQASYESITNQRDRYTLLAPMSGTITFVNYKIGELIVAAAGVSQNSVLKPAFSMLGDAPFQIKVDIPESDIAKVKLNDQARITLDAYGDEVIIQGQVRRIDVAETIISDVVYYRVTVELSPTPVPIKSGMTANVDIITASRDGVLIIPQRAIRESDGKKFVRIKAGTAVSEREIATGLKGDEGEIEATSGVREGEEVVIFEKQAP